MNKFEIKAKKIEHHLYNHPDDYQSVISLFVAKSNAIAYERRQMGNKKKAEIAKYRRESI